MFDIAIVGAGPAGLSAAARCAELGISHILLEASPHIASTIQKYQRGKQVMAEPSVLPLRSTLRFDASRREDVLRTWEAERIVLGVSVRFNAEVREISGQQGDFSITFASGTPVEAKNIVLGIGLQGNLRRVEATGAEAKFIQYQLDDPRDYINETIAIVGAGDAAIENALALAATNKVYIINRRDEFTRAKEANLDMIIKAIKAREIECFYSTSVAEVETRAEGGFAGALILNTATGEARLPVNRVIARLGADPPRRLVESFGIAFPNDEPTAVPELTSRYESNVQGIFIIGALAGYPLIKQAMNQGFEVIEHILGKKVLPADHGLLEDKFSGLPYGLDVDGVLQLIQERVPVFSGVNALQFRELMLDSQVLRPREGSVVFTRNDYTNSFFTLLDGEVEIEIDTNLRIKPEVGAFFGEMSLISGRRRSATVYAGSNCVLIETPRRTMNKLIASVDAVKRVLDETFIVRIIQQKFAPTTPVAELKPIAAKAQIHVFRPGDTIFREGDVADTLHFIRSGSVTVSKELGGREVVISYVPANKPVGEMGLLGGSVRSATVKANAQTETISLDKDSFDLLLQRSPGLLERLQSMILERHQQNITLQNYADSGDMLSFLMGEGLGEATDVLLIDEELCVGCDLCESACAATHDGTSRLNRKAGPTFAHIHVPTSCRHCENPSCMKDCPPDAIQRGGIAGEVFIGDNCIGCGNCEQNCPYGVIQMAHQTEANDNYWSWLLFGLGARPGKESASHDDTSSKKAVKCDMCKDLRGGPACVRACPTGAAIRLNPEDFVDLVRDMTV